MRRKRAASGRDLPSPASIVVVARAVTTGDLAQLLRCQRLRCAGWRVGRLAGGGAVVGVLVHGRSPVVVGLFWPAPGHPKRGRLMHSDGSTVRGRWVCVLRMRATVLSRAPTLVVVNTDEPRHGAPRAVGPLTRCSPVLLQRRSSTTRSAPPHHPPVAWRNAAGLARYRGSTPDQSLARG